METTQKEYVSELLKKRPTGFDPLVETHYEKDGELRYGKWEEYRGQGHIDERTVFPNEIVIDIDTETTEKARQENKKVITLLESEGFDFTVADTGGTGFHIHLFFKYEGLDKPEDYRYYRIALYRYLKARCREEVNAETELWDDQPVMFDITSGKGHLVRCIGGRHRSGNRKSKVLPSSLEKAEVDTLEEVDYPQRNPWSIEMSRLDSEQSDLTISEVKELAQQAEEEEQERHEAEIDTSDIDTRVEGLDDARNIPVSKVFSALGVDYNRKKNFECPFHSDSDPSSNIYEKNGVERHYCFANSCVDEGDSPPKVRNAVDVVMEYKDISFSDAIDFLEEEFDVNVQIGYNPHDYFDQDVRDNYSLQPNRVANEILENFRFKNVIDGGFYVWNGKYWENMKDDNDLIGREVDKRLQNETGSNHRNNIREIIKNREEVQVDMEDFQTPEGLVPFQNGVYNVFEDELVEHKPEYNFDYIYEVSYRPELENSDVKRFIHTIAPESEEKRKKLREIAALSLATWKINQKVPVLYGQGSNGKNQFAKIIWKMVGQDSYHKTSAAKLQADKFEMASVVDKQMAFFDEFEDVKKPGQLKTLIGDERQNVREMMKESYTTTTSVYPIFAANELPNAQDDSDGFYRRWEIIDFKQKFTPDPNDGNPNKIPTSKLEEEYMNDEALDAFATQVMQDLRELIEDNSLTGESTIEETRKKWKKKGNALYAFIDEFLVPGDLPDDKDGETQDYIVKDELLEIVNNYMEANNNSPIKKHRLTQALDAHPDLRMWTNYRPRLEDGSRPRAYAGLQFNENAGPMVQRFSVFNAYASVSPPVHRINESGKWVDMVDHPDIVAPVCNYLVQNHGKQVSLFELVKNLDLEHKDVGKINQCEFIEIDSAETDDHSYPVYSLDLEAVRDADIEIDLTQKKISRKKSLVKQYVESGCENDSQGVEVEEVIESVMEQGLSEEQAEDAIEKLKEKGEFYEPRDGFIAPL